MPRPPEAFVPQTSGQGTGRYSYQRAYDLGFHGTGAPELGKGIRALKTKQINVKAKKPPRPANRAMMDVSPVGDVDTGETWWTFGRKGNSL